MKRGSLKIGSALLCLACVAAWAEPAPWYRWRSRLTGETICMQTSPGAGWEWMPTPYRDARCRIPRAPAS